jgi:hypothetical protein
LPYVITAVEQLILVAMWLWCGTHPPGVVVRGCGSLGGRVHSLNVVLSLRRYKCTKPSKSSIVVEEDTESDLARLNAASAMSPYLQVTNATHVARPIAVC